jgi:putative flippase GtrA
LISLKISKFAILGLFLNIYSFCINIILIEIFSLYKPISYAISIFTSMLISFMVSKNYIFDSKIHHIGRTFFLFAMYSGGFHVIDLVLFTIQVEILSIYYIYAQCISRLLLLIIKYLTYRRLFEQARTEVHTAYFLPPDTHN